MGVPAAGTDREWEACDSADIGVDVMCRLGHRGVSLQCCVIVVHRMQGLPVLFGIGVAKSCRRV